MIIDRYDVLHDPVREEAWKLYEKRFTKINRQAVQRHMLRVNEFRAVCLDDHVQKWLAVQDDKIVGVGVITNDLEAWPLISPEYFEEHYPEQAVWYIGFICSAAMGAFTRLIHGMQEQIRQSRGIAVMDFCTVNMQRNVHKMAFNASKQGASNVIYGGVIDQQSFIAFDFKEG